MNINTLEIEETKPLESAAFCHWPKNEFHHFDNSLAQFKKSERRKLDASYAEIENAKSLRQRREQSEENNRLVITRKSPTRDLGVNDRETALRIYHREWSGEYRVSVESFTRLQEAPPQQCGDRETAALTDRAASKIKDSGAYVAACKGGFKTFCTLTFTTPMRRKIERGHTTIGKEVARFMDGLQKKITRGWTWTPPKDELEGLQAPVRIEGRDHKLNYIWVAESPDKKIIATGPDGESYETTGGINPHVHFLMDWGVERELFDCWAAQIEDLWGNGFATLEKIRNTQSATGYLLKALGYMTKGAQQVNKETGELYNNQGIIKGNRYGISKNARAPNWECISEFEAEHMGQVVREIGERICLESSAIKTRIKQERDYVKKLKASIARLNNPAYRAKIPAAQLESRLVGAESMIEKAKHKLKSLSELPRKMDYSNKFKITFREKHRLDSFIEYAVTKHGWRARLQEHVKKAAHIVPEAHKITRWAASINAKIQESKRDFERYWQSLMSDVDDMHMA